MVIIFKSKAELATEERLNATAAEIRLEDIEVCTHNLKAAQKQLSKRLASHGLDASARSKLRLIAKLEANLKELR